MGHAFPRFNTCPIVTPLSDKSTEDSLLELVQHTFLTLNESRPELTDSCWLCYNAEPPYYKGIAVLGSFSISLDHSSCRWLQNNQVHLTLQSIQGQGTCIGKIPASHKHLCNETFMSINASGAGQYIIPPNNT